MAQYQSRHDNKGTIGYESMCREKTQICFREAWEHRVILRGPALQRWLSQLLPPHGTHDESECRCSGRADNNLHLSRGISVSLDYQDLGIDYKELEECRSVELPTAGMKALYNICAKRVLIYAHCRCFVTGP